MNILFLTIGRFTDVSAHTIYCDLLRQFKSLGHNIYTVSPYEKRLCKKTSLDIEEGVNCLRVKIGNITKCGMIEKGISTLIYCSNLQ